LAERLHCTGTIAILIPQIATTIHLFFVIDDNGAEFRAIETGPGGVVTRVGRKQFPAGDYRE
jgi:hypothetical protein